MTLQRKNCLSKKKKKLNDPKGRPLEKIQKIAISKTLTINNIYFVYIPYNDQISMTILELEAIKDTTLDKM